MMFVAPIEPGRELLLECCDIRDTPGETLPGQDGQLGFRHVEPAAVLWRVMPLEAPGDPLCFGGRECLIEGRGRMRALSCMDAPGVARGKVI